MTEIKISVTDDPARPRRPCASVHPRTKMPKAFTDEERQQIAGDLRQAAGREFARNGYRGATIAEIARSAGVGKGTVYLFYESKAAVFVDVALRLEKEMRAHLLMELNRRFDSPRDRLKHFFRALLGGLENHPILWILLDPSEGPALFNDLTAEMRRRLNQSDQEFFNGLVAAWREAGWVGHVEPQVLSGLGRALFAVSLRRKMVGEESYDQVVDTLVESLAEHLSP